MLSSTTQIQVFNVSYPDIETSVFLSCFHLIGASILAIFLSQRIRLEDFKSLHGLREISLARLYLVLSFFTSWIFLLVSGVLIAGVGLDMGAQWCDAGIVACITLYSFSKLFVYLFLGERVHVVWCPTLTTPRLKAPLYLLCLLFVICYFAVVCHLFVIHISMLSSTGVCMIGMKLDGAIALVTFDVIVSIVMTSLFIWPLLRAHLHNSDLKHIARRSVIAASIALSTSCVNITVLAVMHGVELGWVCLACWEADVLVTAIAFYWLTSGSGLRPMVSIA